MTVLKLSYYKNIKMGGCGKYLNKGKLIAVSGQIQTFYAFIKDIRDFLKKGENILIVRVSSGLEYVRELDYTGIKKFISTEKDGNRGDRGDKRRAFVIKAFCKGGPCEGCKALVA